MLIVGLKPKSPTVSKKLLAMDRSMNGLRREGVAFAFDRESVRREDDDGHMHVGVTNISKANVCPYWGREIPDHEALGLDPNKQYRLYRDPDELAKGAPTFNNKPLLSRHVEISADDHPAGLVVGSTGTDASFEHPFLRNSLVVWKGSAIKDIESEAKKELSSAYRYRADMTPGKSPEGEEYDGVMRDIVGNHVALVKEGRAGTDVVVGDSMENLMSKKPALSRMSLFVAGAVVGALAPKMAADAKPVDIAPLFAGLTAKNYKSKKVGIVEGLKKALEGHLAQDESLEDVVALLDKLEGVKTGADDLDANSGALPTVMPDDTSMDEDDDEAEKKRMEFLKGKLSAEDMATYDSMCAPKATDETPEAKAEREKKEKEAMAAKDADPAKTLEKAEKAMDEKIAKVRADFQGVQEALRKVRPLVGELTVAFDTAEGVYRHVLKMKNVKGHDTMHADALPMALDMQIDKHTKKPAEVQQPMAADEKSAKGFAELFGANAGEHIRVLG
jgi:hypothetical protein